MPGVLGAKLREDIMNCDHAVLIRVYRLRDVLRDWWRMLRGQNGLTTEECRGPLVCRKCGQVVR